MMYESVCVKRKVPASTTVTTVNGSAELPEPVTGVWETTVYVVRGEADPPAGIADGP